MPVRFEGLPAEYRQVDWGEIRHFPFTQQAPGTARATRYFLACRLKYSRWPWVRFTTDMRQETLFRGLVDCFVTLGWVPWVLTFDNMKTVTTGRDAQEQPIWHPALLQLATEFGFHPEACTPGAGNRGPAQRVMGSVESLVKWVKGNFLAGREFAADADLPTWRSSAPTGWSTRTNAPPRRRMCHRSCGCRQRRRKAACCRRRRVRATTGSCRWRASAPKRWWRCWATSTRCPACPSARPSPSACIVTAHCHLARYHPAGGASPGT